MNAAQLMKKGQQMYVNASFFRGKQKVKNNTNVF